MQDFLEISRYEKYLKSHSAFCGISKPDYIYKSNILKKGIDKELKQFNLQSHYHIMSINNFGEDFGLYIPNCLDSSALSFWFDDLAHRFGFCAILEARRILNANYHRVSRLRSRVENILLNNEKSFFLTLTFTNKTLKSTNSLTRRRYVTRFLRSISDSQYVANIDFGAKNGREHYHAVVGCDFINSSLWEYGHLDFEPIIVNEKSIDKVSLYVSKLTNHAIKQTTKRSSLLYPKNKL